MFSTGNFHFKLCLDRVCAKEHSASVFHACISSTLDELLARTVLLWPRLGRKLSLLTQHFSPHTAHSGQDYHPLSALDAVLLKLQTKHYGKASSDVTRDLSPKDHLVSAEAQGF